MGPDGITRTSSRSTAGRPAPTLNSDDADRQARAEAIRAKVKRLRSGEPEPAAPAAGAQPMSPREFVEPETAKRQKEKKDGGSRPASG